VLPKKRKSIDCHLDGDGRKWSFDQKGRQDNGGALRDTCSASTISQLCKDLDVSLKSWRDRDLSKTTYPFLILDGIVIKVREDSKVRPFSLLVATGINQEGYREILGMELGNSETEESWSNFFKDLKARGLKGVDMVISDNL